MRIAIALVFLVPVLAFAEGGYTAKTDPFMQACREVKPADITAEENERVCVCAETGYLYSAAFRKGPKARSLADIDTKKKAILKGLAKMSVSQRLDDVDLHAEIGKCLEQSDKPDFKVSDWTYK